MRGSDVTKDPGLAIYLARKRLSRPMSWNESGRLPLSRLHRYTSYEIWVAEQQSKEQSKHTGGDLSE